MPTVGVIDAVVEQHNIDPITPEHRKRREASLQDIQQGTQQAMSLGVRVASGFDASVPGKQGKNANELIALTKRGMSPLEAIRAATVNGAELTVCGTAIAISLIGFQWYRAPADQLG